ncbi:hypothetical protein CYMTET_27321 [Cymbomonas tetramitiformis]|uniref:Uncharacterized protein n=1 Tax=Cymbomonas tetramitiformis TaxID=36881 RepID=A0AAE0FQ03_9CHLO|nr:hypothetical protein CYMTET_27321 [Cymbomonas tetramitiformis]|eukprot:gene26513-32540_t
MPESTPLKQRRDYDPKAARTANGSSAIRTPFRAPSGMPARIDDDHDDSCGRIFYRLHPKEAATFDTKQGDFYNYILQMYNNKQASADDIDTIDDLRDALLIVRPSSKDPNRGTASTCLQQRARRLRPAFRAD